MSESQLFLEVVRRFSLIEEDEFTFSITYSDSHRRRVFSLEIKECADGHVFGGSSGATIQECCEGAIRDLPAFCKSWGYKVPVIPEARP